MILTNEEGGWLRRKSDQRAAANADQTEFHAICYGTSNFESGVFDERIAGAMDEFDVPDPIGVEDWAEEDTRYDTAADSIGNEIQRRRNCLGEFYPFRLNGNTIEYLGSYTLVYEFCLAISQAPTVSLGEFAQLPPAFERLARDVAVELLGPGAAGYRTGWPPSGDRPQRFRDVVNRLNELTGEWHWLPVPGKPNDPSHIHVKDEGLDFVAWKRIQDGRAGAIFLLGQCACGDDWPQKGGDVDIGRLMDWVRPISATAPLRVFTTPYHIANDEFFSSFNGRAGLTLDRSRITLIAEGEDARDVINEHHAQQICELTTLVLNGG